MTQPRPRAVITTAEAAAIMGTSSRYVTTLVKRGELSGYVYGEGKRKIYRIEKLSVLEFMDRHNASA
jgi:excisionase family DNA binding protein